MGQKLHRELLTTVSGSLTFYLLGTSVIKVLVITLEMKLRWKLVPPVIIYIIYILHRMH